MTRKVKVDIVGLGRMGMEYARNLRYKINNAELVAACSLSDKELQYASKELGIPNIFRDYDQMLNLPELEVIFVISSTNEHATHMIKALDTGKHVFSETLLPSLWKRAIK